MKLECKYFLKILFPSLYTYSTKLFSIFFKKVLDA
ncbi:hypothetical protein 7t3_0146 [Salmonella phage 7t3]|nr:hypothetical protein 7t3_0146 [Salmonella phage 7t3]